MSVASKPKRTIRKFSGFKLQFDVSELEALSKEYADDDTVPFDAGKRIALGQDFSLDNLMKIVEWKSERRADLVKINSADEIEEALSLATSAKQPRTALAVLRGLCGVEVPMASAILTCIDRTRYTVIDWRALEALGVPDDWPITINFYVKHYLPECQRLSQASELDLRMVDRALWSWSRKQSDLRNARRPCDSTA